MIKKYYIMILIFITSTNLDTFQMHGVQLQELSAIAVLTGNFGVNDHTFGNCPLWEYLHKK